MNDTTSPIQITYVKVGTEKRGQKRLWLEGLRLATAGFDAGVRYSVVFDMDTREIILEVDENGDRVVSGRRPPGKETRTPILELGSAAITDIVGEAGTVCAVFTPGRIVFTLHTRDMAQARREARTRANIARGVLTEGTLCAGGGVATLGLHAGLAEATFDGSSDTLTARVEWIVDRERKYLEVANTNNPAVTPSTMIVEASLEEVETGRLCEVDALQISLPCTGQSRAGKSKRKLAIAEDHPTDALAVVGAVRIIDAVQPCFIVSENVKEARTSATYALLRAYLTESGYRLFEIDMNADDAGTLERRERYWLIAISEGYADGFDVSLIRPRARQHATLAEVLDPVDHSDPQWRRHDYLDLKQARDLAAGKGFARQLVTRDSTFVGTIGRSYQKRRSTEPFLQREDGLERLLTPAEHARVKGIPTSLIEGVTEQTAHEVLGQSILLPHAVAIGEAIGRHLLAWTRGIRLAVAAVAPVLHSAPAQASLDF